MMIFFTSLSSKSNTKQSKPIVPLSTADINIVFDGDSLTYGQGGSLQAYPNFVKDWLLTVANSVTFNSFGVQGFKTQDMIDRFATTIAPLVDVNKINILVAWEDVNAILNGGVTAIKNRNDFEYYFNLALNAGFDYNYLVTGYYPRLPLNFPSWNYGDITPLSQQHDYFELIRNIGTNNIWDRSIDLRLNSNIGGAQNQELNSYFVDSNHLTDLGYQEVANEVQASILLDFQE